MKKVILFQVPFVEQKNKSIHEYVIATLHRLGVLPQGYQEAKKNLNQQATQTDYTFSEWLQTKGMLSDTLTQHIETELVRFYTENFKFEYVYTLSFTNENLCLLTFSDSVKVHLDEELNEDTYFNFTLDPHQEVFLMNKYYDACRNLQSIGWNPVAY